MMSTGPATGYAATGVPTARLSMMTTPKVSVRLVNTKQSALAKYSASSTPVLAPAKQTSGYLRSSYAR